MSELIGELFFFIRDLLRGRYGGSKICLECKITRFSPKSDSLDWGDRGHLVASTATLGYRIHVGVDWWTQKNYPRPPSAPKVDQKIAQNPKISDFAWRAYRFPEIVLYLHLFISWNESLIARWKHLRMNSKTQVWHKIHIRVDWTTLFFHPRPPWPRNGGSKISLEYENIRFSDGVRQVWFCARLTRLLCPTPHLMQKNTNETIGELLFSIRDLVQF